MISLTKTIVIIKSPFYLPHIFAYHYSNNKAVINEDIKANNIHWRSGSANNTFTLLFLLQKNKYFRNLFYCRIGSISRLFSWYTKGEPTFHLINCMDGGVYVAHPYATIINAKHIGKNFTCHQCTTIGNKSDFLGNECPTIGDNVIIGANCCIIGNISIGDNVIIGAGSVVVKDIPSNSIVVGNPAHPIQK